MFFLLASIARIASLCANKAKELPTIKHMQCRSAWHYLWWQYTWRSMKTHCGACGYKSNLEAAMISKLSLLLKFPYWKAIGSVLKYRDYMYLHFANKHATSKQGKLLSIYQMTTNAVSLGPSSRSLQYQHKLPKNEDVTSDMSMRLAKFSIFITTYYTYS